MRKGIANVPGVVDRLSNSCDIADMFATKYKELYTSVPCVQLKWRTLLWSSILVLGTMIIVQQV